jgi:retron-type reverse transcriptase
MENILSKFPVHAAATAYRLGQNIADNARPHAVHRYLCKMDFRNFFPSIKSTDFEMLIRDSQYAETWSPDEIDYLSRILFWKQKRRGELRLSIGAPSSPILSNILLYRFDIEVSELCLHRGLTYTRYADDMTFSTNEAKALYRMEFEIPEICTRIASPRLFLNRDKTIHASKKTARRVTGLVLTNDGKVSIGKEKKRQVRAGLHNFSLGKLDDVKAAKLAGMVAYIKSVEPAFFQSLGEKHGTATIRRLFLQNHQTGN